METFSDIWDIESFPNEVLLHIFELLDWKSLQNISETSERFKQLIFSSTKLQNLLFLDVYADHIKEAACQSEQLPYRNISISTKTQYGQSYNEFIKENNELGNAKQIYDFFEKIFIDHKNHIERLRLVNVDGSFLRLIIPHFENLKELRLLEINNYPFNSVLKNNLPNLKLLEVNAPREILDDIQAKNLEKIVIHGMSSWNEKFLETSENLKNLKFIGLSLPETGSSAVWILKLKKLKLNFERISLMDEFMPNEVINNTFSSTRAENFLTSQKESLEELSIEFKRTQISPEGINAVIHFCISELQNLTKLTIKINQTYSNYYKLDKMSINNSIRHLELCGRLDSVNLIALISSCPSVTTFILNNDRPTKMDILGAISTHMQSLKSLKINSFFIDISSKTKFENIEKLEITKLFSNSLEIWHKVTLACPNLKELTLHDETVEIFPEELKRVLKKCRKLEIINFKADWKFRFFQGFFDAFVDYPGVLKRINFYSKYPDELEFLTRGILTDRTNIKVHFGMFRECNSLKTIN